MSKSNQPEGEASGGAGPSSDHGGRGGRGRGRGGSRGDGRGDSRGGYNNGHDNYQAHGSIRQSDQGPSTTQVAPAGPSQATPAMSKRERIRIAAEYPPLDRNAVIAAMEAMELDLPPEYKDASDETQCTEEAAAPSDEQEVVTRNE